MERPLYRGFRQPKRWPNTLRTCRPSSWFGSWYKIQKANKFEQPVELLDIYPTLIDASFDEAYDKLDGESLVSYMKNQKKERLAPAISQNYYAVDKQGYSIRTQRWRYTEWMEGQAGLELYDHDNDPEEKVNLAKKPEYASVIKELRKELRKHSQLSIK